MPPTLPPGFLGVDSGEPTVPNRKDCSAIACLLIIPQQLDLKAAGIP
jgi:hypothetical protein